MTSRPLGFDLKPEDAERFERVRLETLANPRNSSMPSAPLRRNERYAPGYNHHKKDEEMSIPILQRPEPEAKPKTWSRTPAAAAERRAAFLASVRAKFADGDVVTASAAADASGVPSITAADYIQQLRGRGDWPFLPGKRGGKPTIPDFELPRSKVVAKPAATPKLAAPVERPAPPPPVVVEAKPEPRRPAVISHIEAIESWSLGYHLGVAIERIAGGSLEDLKKSVWHINREIARREGEGAAS
jgi:hypothetical protein